MDPYIRTPNLDQLARDGVRFTRGYVTAPQCTPSRAALISGRYQTKLGVEQSFDPMPREVVTLPERLRTTWLATLTPPGPPSLIKRGAGSVDAAILPGKKE